MPSHQCPQCWLNIDCIASVSYWNITVVGSNIRKWNCIWQKLPGCLTHWGRETHICVGKLTIIASDNGLSPSWRQAIIWINAGILLIRPLETNFSEILIGIHTFSLKIMHFKMSSAKRRPFCLGLNELRINCNYSVPILYYHSSFLNNNHE